LPYQRPASQCRYLRTSHLQRNLGLSGHSTIPAAAASQLCTEWDSEQSSVIPLHSPSPREIRAQEKRTVPSQHQHRNQSNAHANFVISNKLTLVGPTKSAKRSAPRHTHHPRLTLNAKPQDATTGSEIGHKSATNAEHTRQHRIPCRHARIPRTLTPRHPRSVSQPRSKLTHLRAHTRRPFSSLIPAHSNHPITQSPNHLASLQRPNHPSPHKPYIPETTNPNKLSSKLQRRSTQGQCSP
jgi:hypothetical protein